MESNQNSAVNPKLQLSCLGPFLVVEGDKVNVKYSQGKKVNDPHLNQVKPARGKVDDDKFPLCIEEKIMKEFTLEGKKKSRKSKRHKISYESMAIRPEGQVSVDKAS